MKALTFLLSLMLATPALAGTSDRGGGNALVCFDSPAIPKAIRLKGNPSFGKITDAALKRITKVEMLDLYQARLPGALGFRHRLVGDIPLEGSYLATELNARIRNFAPAVFRKINEGRSALILNTRYSETGVATIDDVNLLFDFDRAHCVVATLAAQDAKNDELYVDSRLYHHPKHGTASRAAMFLHEWAYYSILRNGTRDSSGVRSVVAKMLVAGGGLRVSELINAADKAGLITSPEEKLNGIQLQMRKSLAQIQKDLKWFSEFRWYIGECRGDLCDRYWKERLELEDDYRQLGLGGCSLLEQCEKDLVAFLASAPENEKAELGRRVLATMRRIQSEIQIEKSVFPESFRVNIGPTADLFEKSLSFPLPEEDCEKAAKAAELAIRSSVVFLKLAAPSELSFRAHPHHGSFETYRKNMLIRRDELFFKRLEEAVSTEINNADLLELPTFEIM